MPFEKVDYNPFEGNTDTSEMTWGEVGGAAVGNIPESAMTMAKDIYQAVRHPVETAKAVGGLAAGVVEKAIPGEQKHELYADSVGQFIVDRYGSEEALKETVANDPVGFLADIATIFTGAGGALKVAGKVPTMSKAARVGEVVTKIGASLEPTNLIAKGGVGALKAIPKSIPEGLYERAAKIPPSMPADKRIKAVRTALEEGIPPTPDGIDMIRARVGEMNTKIDEIVDAAGGQRINTSDMVAAFNELEEFYKSAQVADVELRVMDKIKKQFLKGKESLTIREAQDMKKAIYKIQKNAYKEKISSTIGASKVEARKSIAKGAKEQIAKLFPEIDDINKKESAFLNLEEAIEQRANTITNNNKLNLTALITGGSVGGATGDVISGFGTMVLVSFLTDAKVKSKLAIALRKAKKAKMSDVKVPEIKARLAATQAGRMEEKPE